MKNSVGLEFSSTISTLKLGPLMYPNFISSCKYSELISKYLVSLTRFTTLNISFTDTVLSKGLYSFTTSDNPSSILSVVTLIPIDVTSFSKFKLNSEKNEPVLSFFSYSDA